MKSDVIYSAHTKFVKIADGKKMVLNQLCNFLGRRIDFMNHKKPFDNCPKDVHPWECSLIYWQDVKAGDAVWNNEDGFVVPENPEAEICENCRASHTQKTR